MSLLAVVLLLTPAADQSPSAHNQAALAHFKRGDLEAAYAEFTAAYAASPDPAGDRTAREAAMGSRRSVLLALHARDRRNPEPLCRLASDLRGHIAALVAAHPGETELLEVVGNQERLAAVTRELEPFGADACVAKPEISSKNSSVVSPDIAEGTEKTTVTIPTPTRGAPRSAGTLEPMVPADPASSAKPRTPPVDPASSAKPRTPPSLIVGAVLVPLGLAAGAAALAFVPAHSRTGAAFDQLRDELTSRTCTPADQAEFRRLGAAARHHEAAMVGLGVTAGVLVTTGAVLLTRGRSELRRRQLHLDVRPGAFVLGLSGQF